MGDAKLYDYTEEIESCTHRVPKIHSVDPQWENDAVSIVFECKECGSIGETDGRVQYDDEDIFWYDADKILSKFRNALNRVPFIKRFKK